MSSKRRLHLPAELVGEAEVEADALGVADVEVAVGLRGEAGVDAATILAGFEVGEDCIANEIRTGRGGIGHFCLKLQE